MSSATLEIISQSNDPKAAIQKLVAPHLKKVRHLFSGRVLVGIYIAPEKTPGGILLPQSAKQEDVYQGTIGLVLMKGAMAFRDDETNRFHMQDVEVGDWVAFRPGDAKRVQIGEVDCRIVEDTLIDMIVEDPSIITHKK